jgi:hypothetical protein
MVPPYNIHTPPSAAYTLAFCYGTFKNIVIPLRGMEKLRLWAIVTLLSYFNSASTTGGKYYSLLLGYLQKKYTYFTIRRLYCCLLLLYPWKNIIIPTTAT